MADGLEIAVKLTAIDRMTAVIRKATITAENNLKGFSKKTAEISDSSARVARQSALIGAAIAAPLVFATQKAISFESAMADVAKVANIDRTSQSFKALSANALDLSVYFGDSADNVSRLYSNLLAGGTAQNQLSQVAKIAGEASVAFDISQESAGEAFSVMRNAMNLSVAETKKAFDATNAITNKFGGKASQILEFMSQGGASVARTLKATAPEMEAFGRGLMMNGISAAEAGTVLNRFRVGIYRNAEAMKLFTAGGGGSSGMMKIFEAASKSGDAFKWFQTHRFGEYSSQMALLAGNSGKLGEMLKFVRKETNYVNSAQKEFNTKMATSEMQLKRAREGFNAAAIKAGTAFLPVLTKILNALTPLINRLSKWISANPTLTATIMKVMAGAAALSFAVSGVSFAVSGVTRILSFGGNALSIFAKLTRAATFTKAFWTATLKGSAIATNAWTIATNIASGAMKFMGAAMRILNMVFISSPIGWIALAIAGAAYLIINNWDKIKQFFINLWNKVKQIFSATWEWIKGVFTKYHPVGLIIKNWDSIAEFFGNIWKKVIEKFKGFFDFLKGIPMRMFEAGKNILKSIWEGMKSMAMKPVELIQNVVKKVRNFLPFSPAKEGPLRDIHRIRLIETIADTIKPAPLVRAMRVTTAAAMLAVTPGAGKSMTKMNRAGGSGSIVYSPNVTIQGGSPQAKEDFKKILNEHSKEIFKLVQSENRKNKRTEF